MTTLSLNDAYAALRAAEARFEAAHAEVSKVAKGAASRDAAASVYQAWLDYVSADEAVDAAESAQIRL